MPAEIKPYPWDLLEAVPRAAVRLGREIRHAARGHVPSLTEVGRLLSSLLRADVHLVVERAAAGRVSAPIGGAVVGFRGEGVDGFLWAEPDLATTVVGRAVNQKGALRAPWNAVEPELSGALAAIVAAALRSARKPLQLLPDPPRLDFGLRVELTVLIDEGAHRAELWAAPRERPTVGGAVELHEAGGLAVSLPTVIGRSIAESSDLAALSPGDVFVASELFARPGTGGPSALDGFVAVAAPDSERGARFACSPDGDLVLTDETVDLAADLRPGEMAEPTDTLRENVLDAPVVVRIEVGTVTLTARQWAELRSGDVIQSGKRLSEPVVLRVAGREVARGELVNVDGELGVRIREIHDQSESR